MAQEDPSSPVAGKRKLKIEDLYTSSRDGSLSPKLSTSVSEMRDEIRNMYLQEYGKGMDQFLETAWYTEHGLHYLLEDTALCEEFGGMMELFANTKANDYENFLKIPQIEARVTWMLLCLPRTITRQAENGSETVQPTASNPQLVEVLNRLSIFEHLIINDTLTQNPLAALDDSLTTVSRQHQFWKELGRFVTTDFSNQADGDNSVQQLRQLLDQRENRDVLYSMAVVRHLGPSSSISTSSKNGQASTDEDRLIVARKFIEDEAASKGTTQVVQRLCGMAVRSWVALR